MYLPNHPIYKERVKTCKTCEFMTIREVFKWRVETCSVCKCPINTRAGSDKPCPKGYWNDQITK